MRSLYLAYSIFIYSFICLYERKHIYVQHIKIGKSPRQIERKSGKEIGTKAWIDFRLIHLTISQFRIKYIYIFRVLVLNYA